MPNGDDQTPQQQVPDHLSDLRVVPDTAEGSYQTRKGGPILNAQDSALHSGVEGVERSMGVEKPATYADMIHQIGTGLKKGAQSAYKEWQEGLQKESKGQIPRAVTAPIAAAMTPIEMMASGVEGAASSVESAGKDISQGLKTGDTRSMAAGTGELLGTVGQLAIGREGPEVAKEVTADTKAAIPTVQKAAKAVSEAAIPEGHPEAGATSFSGAKGGFRPKKPSFEGLRVVSEAKPTPKDLIENEGLVYKGELMPGSGVHMMEHPEFPGKTAALKEAELTPEAVRTKMDSKLKEFGVSPKKPISPAAETTPKTESFSGTHYSPVEIEGDKISGETRGKAAAGAEKDRLQHDNRVPGVYVYREGTKPESQIGSRANKYIVKGDKAIADISGAQRDLWTKSYMDAVEKHKAAGENDTIAHQKALNDAEASLQKAGYHGYENPDTMKGSVFLFGDQTVEKPSAASKGTTFLSDAADEFNKSKGRPAIETAHVDPDVRQDQIGDAYKAAVHAPNDPAVKASYDALKRDIDEQYELAKKLGIKIDVKDENPYGLSDKIPAHEELHNDVIKNKHLSVWSGGAPPADHPLSEVDPKTGMTYNEKFRAVHDIFGHVAEKTDFTPRGEESAWNLHRQMFSDEAKPALATETRGQAAYTYKYGDFPPQKAAILPEEFQNRAGETKPKGDWATSTADQFKEQSAGAVNPKTGRPDAIGTHGVEVYPEARQSLDHPATAEDVRAFYEKNKSLFDKHPELRVGWDQNGRELNIGASGIREGAEWVGRKLDQRSIWDIANEKEIPTGGSGQSTKPPARYSLEERLNDLSGKGFGDLQKDFPKQAEVRGTIRAGQQSKTWWADSREAMKLIASSDPEAAHDIGQFLTAVSSNKGNDLALRLGLNIYMDWVEAGKPSEPGAISQIAENTMAKIEDDGETGSLFSNLAPEKSQRVLPIDKGMLERYVSGQGTLYHPTDLRSAKIAQMGQTMAGDPWAGVLDRHTGRTMAYGKEMQPMAKNYFAMKAWLRQAAESENMTLEEAQAANWVVGRLLSPDTSLTAPEILAKIKSGDTLKAGETYADLIVNDPKVRDLAKKLIAKSGGDPEQVLGDIKKITERPKPGVEESKKTASNPTFRAYLERSVRERGAAKLAEKSGGSSNKRTGKNL